MEPCTVTELINLTSITAIEVHAVVHTQNMSACRLLGILVDVGGIRTATSIAHAARGTSCSHGHDVYDG
jgi:hypothetical protein